MSIISKVISWVGLALACNIAIRFALLLDWNKEIHSYVPGPCKAVRGINDGAIDIELIADDTAIISTASFDGKGQLYLFEFVHEKPRADPISLQFDKHVEFIPRGISSFESKEKIFLYAVNKHPNGDRVEKFAYDPGHKTLMHTKTIQDSGFRTLVDIAMVGPDRFYATNEFYFTWGFLQFFERYLPMQMGDLIYFDGKSSKIVDNWLAMPQGVTINGNQTFLYVAMGQSEILRAYEMKRDDSIKKKTDMSLMTSPSFMTITQEGEIWVATNPVLHKLFQHLNNPRNSTSPSQVVRVRPQPGHASWLLSAPWADDGIKLSGNSFALYHKQHLMIGSRFGKLFHCPAPDPDLL